MRPIRPLAGAAVCLTLVALSVARAEAPPDPLRLVPCNTDVLIDVPQPRKLLESVTALDAFQRLQQIQAVQEYLQSQNVRRFYTLIRYFEKELGAPWPELLDRLAGGGAVVGIKYGDNPTPSLLVIQGKDAALVQKFVRLGLQIIENSPAQQDAKGRLVRKTYRQVETIHAGKELHAAVVNAAVLISNLPEILHKAIDLALDGPSKSMAPVESVAESRRQLPSDPLIRLWLKLESVRALPQAKDVFMLPRNNAAATAVFGGWLDVAGRSPYLCAGLHAKPDGFVTTVRMPRGRAGMAEAMAVHVPPLDQPGCRPLLEPRGVLLSSSFFLDVGKFWEDRAKLFTPEQVKTFEEGDKRTAVALAGNRLSSLLTQVGVHHRFVVVHQDKPGYQKTPRQSIPAFALVVEPREPAEFAKTMNTVLRGAALLAGLQFKLRLVEENQGEHLIVGYRFPEDATIPGDVNDLRFNFSPCFVSVGRSFVFCSTLELAHELVRLLEEEAKSEPGHGRAVALRTQLYAPGGAEYLQSLRDVLLTQAVLGQALEPDVAAQEIDRFIAWVRRLGVVQIESEYGSNDWHYDIRLILGK
jgi:hypothetical protein